MEWPCCIQERTMYCGSEALRHLGNAVVQLAAASLIHFFPPAVELKFFTEAAVNFQIKFCWVEGDYL